MKKIFYALPFVLFYSCASIFIPRKQKISLITGKQNSTTYLDNEELGTGDTITKKIHKWGTYEVLLRQEGFKDKRVALTPTHRSPGYKIAKIFDLPFSLVLFGAPWFVDKYNTTTMSYDRYNRIDGATPITTKKPSDKFIELSGIKFDIRNLNTDITNSSVDYSKFSLPSAIENMESQMGVSRGANAKKSNIKKNKLDDQTNKSIKYTEARFSDNIYRLLKTGGYIDTVNVIFPDNNNTLVLEGKVSRINFWNVYVGIEDDSFRKAKIFLTWYIKNTYGEILDSLVTNQLSDDFVTERNKNGVFVKMIADALEQSYLNLHKNGFLLKHLNQQKETENSLNNLQIAQPLGIVSEKQHAQEASVIVKTKKGHGSGFVVTNDGYIITNYHVVSGSMPNIQQKITIITSENQELNGVLVRYNKTNDLALIKVEKNFQYAFLIQNESKFKPMMNVYTIGTPKSLELGQSISVGIISNERKVNNNNLIQLGISVNSGNSGGPVFDANGGLHGVIVSKLVGQNTEGIGFAIPSYLIQNYLKIEYK